MTRKQFITNYGNIASVVKIATTPEVIKPVNKELIIEQSPSTHGPGFTFITNKKGNTYNQINISEYSHEQTFVIYFDKKNNLNIRCGHGGKRCIKSTRLFEDDIIVLIEIVYNGAQRYTGEEIFLYTKNIYIFRYNNNKTKMIKHYQFNNIDQLNTIEQVTNDEQIIKIILYLYTLFVLKDDTISILPEYLD